MIARLCYASKRVDDQESLLEDLIDILTVARNFNADHNIYGVLYYADNAFFQCLEGDKDIIESLFERIKSDVRHHAVKHFSTVLIDQYCFKKWSMKYVEKDSDIDIFFKNQGSDKFDPILLNDQNIPDFIEHLILSQDTPRKPKPRRGFANRGITPLL